MSTSTSLHALAAPQHFERIAKNLLEKRKAKDYSTCDVKINLKDGDRDMVHRMVVTVYSTYFNQLLENQRAPYQPINMCQFEPTSVKRVIDWMYSGEIDVPETELANDMAVASFLRVSLLQYQFEQSIQKDNRKPIDAINIASAIPGQPITAIRKENAFRPQLTTWNNVHDDTMKGLVLNLAASIPTLTKEQVNLLTNNSILACMSAVLPLEVKVPLINLAIQWILNHKCDHFAVSAITQSIVISDVTFETLYALRYSLKQYLSNPKLAGKGELAINSLGVIGLTIDPRKGKDKKTPNTTTTSNSGMVQNRGLVRTKSEMSELERIPDVFARSPATASDPMSPCFRRETTDGFPKYFTKSEVQDLRAMSDPFIAHPNEHPPQVPRMIFDLTRKPFDPFDGLTEQEFNIKAANAIRGYDNRKSREPGYKTKHKDPVVMKPYLAFGEPNPWGYAGPPGSQASNSNQSFSQRPYSNGGGFTNRMAQLNLSFEASPGKGSAGFRTNNGIVSSNSSTSTAVQSSSTTSIRNPPMHGIQRTASEIAELNAYPDINASSTVSSGVRIPQSNYLYPM